MGNFFSDIGKAISKPFEAVGQLAGNVLGINNRGPSFKPTLINLPDYISIPDLQTEYERNRAGLNQQQAFVNALLGQGALTNQSNVFKQLQEVASGQGANPAMTALQTATGQNIAAQNALMAGQRGGSRNVGLLARQAGQQGGALQQQAGGQAATLQAQQQLGALGQLGGLANQQAAQLQTGITNYSQLAQAQQQALLNAFNQQQSLKVGQQNSLNQIGAELNKLASQKQGGLLGGLGSIAQNILPGALGGVGDALSGIVGGAADFLGLLPALNQGGEVPEKPKYALGGMATNQPQSYVANYFANPNQMLSALNKSDNLKEANLDYSTLADGGAVYRSGNYANGGMTPKLMIEGGHVPGKAVVKGDSLKNDIVDAKLSPGEIVIPRSIVNHPNAAQLAAKFVQDTLNKKKNFADGGLTEDADISDEVVDTEGADEAPITVPAVSQEPVKVPEYQQKALLDVQTGMPKTTTEKGIDLMQAALNQQGDIAKQRAVENATAIANAQNLLNQKYNELNLHKQDIYKKIGQVQQDIATQKIDPRRFVSNMSTLDKIGTSIGLILGGMGAGLTGGENVVVKQLNNYIDQDILAQRAELGKKQSLLEANYKDLGNINEAMMMTKAMMNDSLAMQMNKIANQYEGKTEAARLRQAAGALMAQNGNYIDQLAQYKAYTSPSRGTASAGETTKLPVEMDPRKETRIDVGNQVFYASNPAQKQKAQSQIDAITEAERTLSEMQKIENAGGMTKFVGNLPGAIGITSPFMQKGTQLREQFVDRLADAEGLRLGQSPLKVKRQLSEKLIPDAPGQTIDFSEQVKYDNLKAKLAQDKKNILNSLNKNSFLVPSAKFKK